MGNTPYENLLLQNLQNLTDSVEEMRRGQDEMHRAVTALDMRVASVESGMHGLKKDVKREARRWGAVGGAATSAAGIIAALVKTNWK